MIPEAAMDSLPPEVFEAREYTYIHAAVLFADMENSVVLSSALAPADYDELIDAFHVAMLEVVKQLRDLGFPIGEVSLAGDQLALFFYDEAEVGRNFMLDTPGAASGEVRAGLIDASRKSNDNLAYAALRSAILIKNAWLTQPSNMQRLMARRVPLGLAMGIHTGRVYLRTRADGKRRIEGYTVNLAKRIEGFARHGRFSRIMLGQGAHDAIRGMVLSHTQLSQRIFFHRHDAQLELMKGISDAQAIYELKFFSLIGIKLSPEAIKQYEALFHLNHNDLWAYYQLFEYYAYQQGDWERVLTLAQQAHLVHPQDEKTLLDLSRACFRQGDMEMAREFALQALSLNTKFDLVYEHLAMIALKQGDVPSQAEYARKAASLAPGSPINHMNLGLALCELEQIEAAEHHIQTALRLYPSYLEHSSLLETMRELHALGKLPAAVGALVEAVTAK